VGPSFVAKSVLVLGLSIALNLNERCSVGVSVAAATPTLKPMMVAVEAAVVLVMVSAAGQGIIKGVEWERWGGGAQTWGKRWGRSGGPALRGHPYATGVG
jgi:hypothetical protein